ncbi:MAG: prenyltransferase/squalene oxidase repeat-containing protein [Oscillospiraceae bacterium]
MKHSMRFVSLLLAIVFTVAFSVTVMAAPVEEEESISVVTSIIDKTSSENKVQNIKLQLIQTFSVPNTLRELEKQNKLSKYVFSENELTSVTFNNGNVLQAHDEFIFTCRINGKFITKNLANTVLANGDIVEWLYINKSEITASNIESGIMTSSASQDTINKNNFNDTWNEKMSKSLTVACEWLLVKDKPSENYFIALGSAGKTASVKSVNQYLKSISQKKSFDTPLELEKSILTTTFCGFDARKIGKLDLVKILSSYEEIASYGLDSLSYALLALDSNNYVVEGTRINNRNALINLLLTSQNANGSFWDASAQKQEYLAQTATAISALSKYSPSNADVKKAVKYGLDYIKATRNKRGEYVQNGTRVSSITLSKLIIAFSSNSISITDKAYFGNARPLEEQLLEYQNSDGGFGINDSKTSDQTATEFAVLALSSIRSEASPYIVGQNISPQSYVIDQPNALSAIIKDKKSLYVVCICAGLTVVFVAAIIIILKKKKHKNKDAEI